MRCVSGVYVLVLVLGLLRLGPRGKCIHQCGSPHSLNVWASILPAWFVGYEADQPPPIKRPVCELHRATFVVNGYVAAPISLHPAHPQVATSRSRAQTCLRLQISIIHNPATTARGARVTVVVVVIRAHRNRPGRGTLRIHVQRQRARGYATQPVNTNKGRERGERANHEWGWGGRGEGKGKGDERGGINA